MSHDWLSRSAILFEDRVLTRLNESNVIVVGLGGVGSFAVEFLVRAGVGRLVLMDGDTVDNTNRNRQLQALRSTVGYPKAEILARRMKDINPDVELIVLNHHFEEKTCESTFNQPTVDFVVDAIDALQSKALLIEESLRRGFPIVSAMGAAGRMDPSMVSVVPFHKTHGDGLAAHLRRRLRRSGVSLDFPAVFSPERIDKSKIVRETSGEGAAVKASVVGTVSYIPAVFGAHAASIVIRHLTTPIRDEQP